MYNGHKNHAHWNVSLWLNNDEGLYSMMRSVIRRSRTRDEAARKLVSLLAGEGMTHTPDGVRYSVTAVRAAMVGV